MLILLGQPEEVVFKKATEGRQRMSSASQNARKSKLYEKNYQNARVTSARVS